MLTYWILECFHQCKAGQLNNNVHRQAYDSKLMENTVYNNNCMLNENLHGAGLNRLLRIFSIIGTKVHISFHETFPEIIRKL